MKKILFFLLTVLFFTTSSEAQLGFTALDTNFVTTSVIVPSGYTISALFKRGDDVYNNFGQFAPAKRNFDYICYVPIGGSSSNGWLFVNHEANDSSTILGDGGGASTFQVQKNGSTWSVVGQFRALNFNHTGGTLTNCAGGANLTPWGTVLTVEEFPPFSNAELYRNGAGFRDTSDFLGFKRWQNMGFITECNAELDTVLKKHYAMGRFSHEAALPMQDGKTVYLTDDWTGGPFFKFVSDAAGNYNSGQLYAYKQTSPNSGTWISLPMQRDSLNNCRDIAFRLGATIFIRMEDIDIDANGNIYIAETGADSANLSPSINAGGVPAMHLNSQFVPSTQRYDDPYGRILKFNPSTGAISVYLEGGSGTGQNAKYTFSNPDNIALDRTRNLLFIQEDLIGNNRGRNPSYVPSAGSNWICEGYMLDLNINNPTVNNCKLFTIFPKGAEVTGGYYTPDYSTLFINVQHPSGTNPVPFNTDVTIAVTGFPPVGIKGSNSTAEKFSLNQNYPNPFNPATKITFSLPDRDFVTLKVFDELGREITVLINGVLDKGSYEVTFDGLDLPSGMYFYFIKADGHSDAKKMLLIK